MTAPDEALAHERAEQKRKILEMPAGPALDAEVSRVVFGEPDPIAFVGYRCYSTDPGAAWSVVEALPGCCTRICRENVAGVRYDATINLDIDHVRTFHVMADTMPLAVARCALLATFEARRA